MRWNWWNEAAFKSKEAEKNIVMKFKLRSHKILNYLRFLGQISHLKLLKSRISRCYQSDKNFFVISMYLFWRGFLFEVILLFSFAALYKAVQISFGLQRGITQNAHFFKIFVGGFQVG